MSSQRAGMNWVNADLAIFSKQEYYNYATIPYREQYIKVGIQENVLEKYLESVTKHIQYVRKAGENLGVPFHQLNEHDMTKFSYEQFGAYANYFFGEKNYDTATAFSRAWLQHLQYEKHHWQHWIFPDNFTPKMTNVENGVLEMPKEFALEMIADWLGASMTYTENWDITEWLSKNAERITLHSKTATFVNVTLNRLGYKWYPFNIRK